MARIVAGGLTLANGKNIIAGTSTGTKIATTSTQKLAFFGKTSVTQRNNILNLSDSTGGNMMFDTLVATADSDANDNFARINTRIDEIIQVFTDLGLTS